MAPLGDGLEGAHVRWVDEQAQVREHRAHRLALAQLGATIPSGASEATPLELVLDGAQRTRRATEDRNVGERERAAVHRGRRRERRRAAGRGDSPQKAGERAERRVGGSRHFGTPAQELEMMRHARRLSRRVLVHMHAKRHALAIGTYQIGYVCRVRVARDALPIEQQARAQDGDGGAEHALCRAVRASERQPRHGVCWPERREAREVGTLSLAPRVDALLRVAH